MYSFLRNIYYKIFYGRSYKDQKKADEILRQLRIVTRQFVRIQNTDRKWYYNQEYRNLIAKHNELTDQYCKVTGPLHDVCI